MQSLDAPLIITLEEVYEARERIRAFVRRTPTLRTAPLRTPVYPHADIYLKLENMQVSGSFKARGAMNKLQSIPPNEIKRGIVAASGGNHGLGVAYAGYVVGVPVTIFLPKSAAPIKAHKLQGWGARVVYAGDVFDDANHAAVALAEHDHLPYFHPFADPAVIAGQGTIGLELLEDVPEVDTVIVAIGGGGLISGIGRVVKALRPGVRVIGVEPTGAPTYYEARRVGHPVMLPEITTIVNTLAPRQGAAINFAHIEAYIDEIVLVTDDEMRQAARWMWTEMGIAAELAGAAAIAGLLTGRIVLRAGEKACVVVCGAGTDGIDE